MMNIEALLRGADRIVEKARNADKDPNFSPKTYASELQEIQVALQQIQNTKLTASQSESVANLLKKMNTILPAKGLAEQAVSQQVVILHKAFKDLQSALQHLHSKTQQEMNRKVTGKQKGELL